MTRESLDAVLRHAVILGTLAVLLIPAARGSNEWLGWLPLWLVGMPLAAWWSLRGCPRIDAAGAGCVSGATRAGVPAHQACRGAVLAFPVHDSARSAPCPSCPVPA